MATEGVASAAGPNRPGASATGSNLVMQVAAAVATGIGVLGFVTFFGGAILWIRAKEGGLAANEVVSVIPKPVLVTTGASFLVPAMLLALLAVGVVCAVHVAFRLPGCARRHRRRARVEEAQAALAKAELRAERRAHASTTTRASAARARAAYATAMAGRSAFDAAGVAMTAGLEEQLADLQAQAHDTEMTALREERRAGNAEREVTRRTIELRRAETRLDLARTPGRRWRQRQRWAEYGTALVMLTIVPLFVLSHPAISINAWITLLLVLLAIATFVVSVATYVATDRFVWVGVVAFLAMGTLIGAATYFRTTEQLKVAGAAVLRAERPPLIGWFVAQTSTNLYLATFSERLGEKRLVIIPRATVTDVAVGPLLSPTEARQRALALAIDLCDQETPDRVARTSLATAVTRPAGSSACTRAQIDALQLEL